MIRLLTLGGPDARGNSGEPLTALLAQPKRFALLVYLALATPRGAHQRDSLLALFWPELDSEHARNALSQAVHFLRRAVGNEALPSTNGGALAVGPGQLWCDALAFEDALATNRRAEAVELYQGDLLDAFHVADAPEFERWLSSERTRLADRFTRTVESLAAEREAAGDFPAAVSLWRRLAARDPYNSRVALGMIRATAKGGDPAGALRHARVHETLLRHELSAAPSHEVRAFVESLRSQPAASPASVVAAPAADDAALETLDEVTPAEVERAAPTASVSAVRRLGRQPTAVSALLLLLVAATAVTALRSLTGATTIRSIAVLPFDNLSRDSSDRIFADGMHHQLIAELARYPGLTVISRTSVEQYRGTTKTIPEIARELKVDGIIEGTVLRDGGSIRMNAQLIHAPSDAHRWTQSYRRDLRDMLVVQRELAQAIAGEIRIATRPAVRSTRVALGPADSAPHEVHLRQLYDRGVSAETARNREGLLSAKAYYRAAIQRDSSFALGYAGLSQVYGFLADYDFAPVRPALDSAWLMAERAVALDSTLPEARAALGVVFGNAHDFVSAEREFRRAIELGPSNARAHYWYSILLVALGRGDEALREAQRARELDPFAPRGLTGMLRYAEWLVTGRRPHLTLPVYERRPILRVEPGEPWARGQEALEHAWEGNCNAARVELARAERLAPGSRRMLAYAASVNAHCGSPGRARVIIEHMKRRPDANDHGYRIALAYIELGDKDSAFTWLRRNKWTMGELSGLSADLKLDPLRADPRFLQLLQDIGTRPRDGVQLAADGRRR